MKCFSLLILLISLVGKLDSQTAEEILWKTQGTYRKLTNYVDEAMIPFQNPYPAITSSPDTLWYFLAMDKKQNIAFWFRRNSGEIVFQGSYYKAEKETTGICHNPLSNDPGISCTPAEAVAYLEGGGYGRFSLIGSLMYPDFTPESPGDSSIILYYDTATKLEDTTIHGSQCFVIQTKKTIIIPQEYADRQNFIRDSTQGMFELPPEQRGVPRIEAGPKTSARKYYIRKSDYIILKAASLRLQGDTDIVKSQSTIDFSPRVNVKDFKKYLEE